MFIVVAAVVILIAAITIVIISGNGLLFFHNETSSWLGSLSEEKNPVGNVPLSHLYEGSKTENPVAYKSPSSHRANLYKIYAV